MDTCVQEQMDTEDKLRLLKEGEIGNLKRIADASNASIFCTISKDELACHAIYKPIAGERPLWDFPDGNLASREYAAYLISEAAGFKCVPPTVLRDGPFGFGALQYWVEELDDWGDQYLQELPGLRSIALFDVVINNTDRKIGHLLFKGNSIYACDHGVTFHQNYKLRTVLWQFANKELNEIELVQLENLLQNIPTEIDNLITISEKNALIDRIESLLISRKFPLPPTDWPAVPWPPF